MASRKKETVILLTEKALNQSKRELHPVDEI